MIKNLAHIGVAVKNLDESIKIFSKLFGIGHAGTEVVEDQKVKVAFFHIDGASIELTAPTAPSSPIARFIEKRGENVHHLSFEVDDIRAELKRLKAEGFQLIDEEPRLGAGGYWIAFVHPTSTNGVLVEISQKVKA
ncbi:MAG: methylmalonyl-CoA epimerase [Ignavibacteriae bacterium]|nr:methylmalonyl-CoA epimerase [Ignavibacteriota bacterium]